MPKPKKCGIANGLATCYCGKCTRVSYSLPKDFPAQPQPKEPQQENERLEKEIIKEFLKPKQEVEKMIPCNCLKGGYILDADGGERVCPKCGGSQWITPPADKEEVPAVEFPDELKKSVSRIEKAAPPKEEWVERFRRTFTPEWFKGFGTTDDIDQHGYRGIFVFLRQEILRAEERGYVRRGAVESEIKKGVAEQATEAEKERIKKILEGVRNLPPSTRDNVINEALRLIEGNK